MRHRKKGRKLNMTAAHRRAVLRNMATSLFRHERIETTTRFGSSAFNYGEGDRVSIRYDPENPSAIAIDSFVGLWLIPVCLTGFGACFMFVGLVIGVAVLI